MTATYLVKRAVAFRVPVLIGDGVARWNLYQNEHEAYSAADTKGVEYEALFNRNGDAIVAEWESMESAPKDGSSFLGVWWSDISVGKDPLPHVGICSWAGAWTPYDRKLTHWMPLPVPPRISPALSNGSFNCQNCERECDGPDGGYRCPSLPKDQ
jgi:hypothetical protein